MASPRDLFPGSDDAQQFGGGDTTFSEFTDPSADRLLDKVDFVGAVQALGRGAWLAIVSVFAAVLLAARDAVNTVLEVAMDQVTAVYLALFGTPATLQSRAVEVTASELDVFGLFALPVSAVVALVTLGGILVVLVVFGGFGD